MKKIYLFVALLGFFAFNTNVKADTPTVPKITTAEYKNSKITIKGTGAGQIQLVLFDLENAPLYMTTVQATNGEFSLILPQIDKLVSGNYKIKVADYNGANVDSKTVNVTLSKNENNPKTGDNIFTSIIFCGLSVIGILGCIISFKRKKIINEQ